MLKVNETAAVMVDAVTDNAKLAATITAGNILNSRINRLIAPKLPLMIRGYASTDYGEAAISYLVSAVLIHTMPENEKVLLAVDAIQKAAMIKLGDSFNIEAMVDELFAGVPLLDVRKTDDEKGEY